MRLTSLAPGTDAEGIKQEKGVLGLIIGRRSTTTLFFLPLQEVLNTDMMLELLLS